MSFVVRFCLLLLLLPLAVAAREPNLDFEVTGLAGELEDNVRAFLGTAPQTDSERLNFVVSARARVRDALQALGHYRPVIEIDVQREEPVWRLDIAVDPGEPVRIREIDIRVLGSARDDPRVLELAASPGFAEGEVLHHGRFEDFRSALQALGQQRGYLDGEIVTSVIKVQPEAGTADVLVRFDSGPRYRFGELLFDGSLVDRALLDTMATFQPGDDFDQPRLRRLQSNLLSSGYFAQVIVQPRRDLAHAGEVPIELNLLPAKRHSFDVGLGYSTDTEERISLTWRTPKLNRFGHSQVTRLQYSPVNPSGRFTYTIPMSSPLTDVVQLWARLEENEYGDIKSRQMEAGTRRETQRGKWLYSFGLRGLNESWDGLFSSPENDYLLLGAALSSRETSGSLVDPTSGFNQLYTLEAGSDYLGSDIDVLRGTALLRYIATPRERHRVLTRAELGAVTVAGGDRRNLAPSLSFFAGGSQSIRGYAYQSLGHEERVERADGSTRRLVVGGEYLAIASLEYQYYLSDSWRGALFVDGGDAFDEGNFDAKVGVGFGVHYITPVGAIRVELANSVSESNPDWYFHLTIGAEF